MLGALRIPDFRLLWGGSLVSSLGSWLLVVAIPAHILMATGSLRDTGLTLVAEYLPPLVIGPVAGVIADRCDRRRLMIATNLFCAAAVASMLLGTSPGRYWVLYAALVAENSGAVLYAPAVQARTPAIVGTGPLLSSANALNSASSGTVRLIGGPLGGILLTIFGIRWLIGADVLSYLLSAAAMFLTSRTRAEPASGNASISGVARDFIQGIRALQAKPAARALLPVTVIFLAANASLSAILIPFGVQRLGGSDNTGLLLCCLGAGFLVGAPLIRPLLDRSQPRHLLTATLAATAAAYYLLFTSSSLATALPAAAAVGMTGSMSLVIPQIIIQRVIPGAALGRVSAIFLTSQAAATLTGAVAGPFLAQAAHLTAAAITASLLTIGAAGLAYLTVPRLPPVVPAPEAGASTRAERRMTHNTTRKERRARWFRGRRGGVACSPRDAQAGGASGGRGATARSAPPRPATSAGARHRLWSGHAGCLARASRALRYRARFLGAASWRLPRRAGGRTRGSRRSSTAGPG